MGSTGAWRGPVALDSGARDAAELLALPGA
jgi:hypothetical protein